MRYQTRIRALAQRVALPAILLFVTIAPAAAQSTQAGSIYSRFGVGDRRPAYEPKLFGMGGGGTALGGGSFTSILNPALLSDLTLTRAAGGLHLESVRATDAAGGTSDLQSGSLAGFAIGLPLLPPYFPRSNSI